MSKVLDDMCRETESETRLSDTKDIMEGANRSLAEVLKLLKIPESDDERYASAI